MKTKAGTENMKKICFISIVAFIMLLCMASSPQQSLQSRLFGFWAPSGDEVTTQHPQGMSSYLTVLRQQV